MSSITFSASAERSYVLRGPAERTVTARIGMPEPDPEHSTCFRCPFQVLGLSDDGVYYAVGVDSFQALSLAFAGVRSAIKANASVLASLHTDFSLTWQGGPWELSIPICISANDLAQQERLEHFLEHDFWRQHLGGDA